MKKFLAMSILTLVMACNTIETPDGKIPAQYLPTAKTFEGAYQGTFEKIPGELRLSLNVDVPALAFTAAQGQDLLGAGCTTTIGRLLSISTSRDSSGQEVMDGARFELNPGNCAFEGRFLDVSFETAAGVTTMKASAIKAQYMEHVPGDMDCYTNSHGNVVCHHTPGHTEIRYLYVTGKFKKGA